MFWYRSGDPGARIAREARELGGEHKARLSLLSVLQSHISMPRAPRDRGTSILHACSCTCMRTGTLVLVLFTRYFSDLSQLNLDTINVKILD